MHLSYHTHSKSHINLSCYNAYKTILPTKLIGNDLMDGTMELNADKLLLSLKLGLDKAR